MGEEFVEVEGIEECCRDLGKVSAEVAGVGVINGLQAAGDVLERAIAFRTPTRIERIGGDAEYTSLVTNLDSRLEIDSNNRGGSVQVGFFRQAHVADWVENGHRVVGHKPGQKALGEVLAHPFMRPAADGAAEAATEAFIEGVNESLQQFGESE